MSITFRAADGLNETPVSAATPLPVDATVNASVAGFTPNGNVANLSVTSSTGNVALPAGVTVVVTNKGSNTAFIKLSVGAGTAATTDMALVAGAAVGLTVGSNTYINAITASSTTTINIAGGAGLATGYGGGSSGGGSGGAVTVADGADVTLGTTTDAKSTATDSTGVTLMQVTKQISASAQLSATAAKQDTLNTNVTTVNTNLTNITGTKAAGTAAANAALVGAVYNSTPPTLTNGQQAALQADAAGNVKVSGVGVAQSAAISGITLSPIAGESLSTTPTRTTAQVDIPVLNLAGSLCVQPYGLPDMYVSGLTSAMTGTTSTAVTGIGAPGSGLFNYITQITVGNSHATVGTFVELQDGSGGTTFYTIPAAAVYGGAVINLNPPLKQPTANTALYCKNTTTGANVILSANGYKGK